jgi:Pectate lyase superfamily protein
VFYNVRDFGAQGDGRTDDLPAFERALKAMKPIPPLQYVKGGGVLLVPAGNYYLSRTLVLTQEVQLLGISGHQGKGGYLQFYRDAAGVPQFPAGLPGGVSQLLFPRGVTGIRVAYDGSRGQEQGAGSIIRNLVLVGEFEAGVDSLESNQFIDPDKKIFNQKYLIPKMPNDPTKIGHGISSKLQVVIDNCFIYHFNGNGIHFVAPAGPPEKPDRTEWLDFKNPELGNLYLDNAYVVDGLTKQYQGNVIDSRVVDCFVRCNGLNGVYIFGSNSGNLIFDKVHCIQNGRYGFFDSERSAANLYLGCHSQINLKGGYYCLSSGLFKKADGSLEYLPKTDTGSIYIGCYQENDGTRIYAPAMVIGGTLGIDGIILSDSDPDAKSLAGIKGLNFNAPSVMRTNGNGSANAAFPNGIQAYCGGKYQGGAIELGGGVQNVALTLYHQPNKIPAGIPQPIKLDTNYNYRLRYIPTEDSKEPINDSSLQGWWELSMSGVGLSSPLRFSTEESAVGKNQLWLENGMYLGNGDQNKAIGRVLVRTGAAKPIADGNPGDIIFNSNPVTNGYAGWIFVAGNGWRPYGKIE